MDKIETNHFHDNNTFNDNSNNAEKTKLNFAKKEAKRSFIFIDATDKINPNSVITKGDVNPAFRPPFPPLLDDNDLLIKRLSKNRGGKIDKKPVKPPNAFIIYRRTYVKAAIAEGYKLPMTVISTMASQAWNYEPPVVKAEYKRIAKSVRLQHDIEYPKSIPKQSRNDRSATKSIEAAKNNNDSYELNEQFNSSTESLSSPSLQDSDLFTSPPSSTLVDFDFSDLSFEPIDSLPNQQQDQDKFIDFVYDEDFFAPNLFEFEKFINSSKDNNNNYINTEDINLNSDVSLISKESSVEQSYKQISSISKRSSKLDDLEISYQLNNLNNHSFNEQYVAAADWLQFIPF
ncbi:3472_t:CDS:1 [Ambispora gerdemannii]|uniref:3472_t:CDS:1 n=1 Tax=Ambispora gerdemannii TaxID=144530 RepID=A0A9N8WPL0_9GLOM|nr:3472_t:CDS:1 [Ambispora gerdemannii]